jgi:hypothetical protein
MVWRTFLVGLALAQAGCRSGAYWEVNQKAPSYRLPQVVTLYVAVSEQVNQVDTAGAVLTAMSRSKPSFAQPGIECEWWQREATRPRRYRASSSSFWSSALAIA